MQTPTKKRFGSWLRRQRLARKITQRELSKHLGYDTPQFVSNWERGMVFPPSIHLNTIAKALKIPYRVLVDELYAAKARELREEHKAARKAK